MIHQLRVYEIFEETREAFLDRFRDHAARIMGRHGFRIRAMWEARTPERLEFVYLLEWPDEATMTAAWATFMADAEWAEIKRLAAASGKSPMVGRIEEKVLRPVDVPPGL